MGPLIGNCRTKKFDMEAEGHLVQGAGVNWFDVSEEMAIPVKVQVVKEKGLPVNPVDGKKNPRVKRLDHTGNGQHDAIGNSQFAGMTVVQLKQELRAQGLPVSGVKRELLARLGEAGAGRDRKVEEVSCQEETPGETVGEHEEVSHVTNKKRNCVIMINSQTTISNKLALLVQQKEEQKIKGKKKKGAAKSCEGKSKYFPAQPTTKWRAPPGYEPDPAWHPPPSPYHLFEEKLYCNPWRLLTGCIFLTKTTHKVALPIMAVYFSRWSCPQAASEADEGEVAKLLQPMGLHRLRARMLGRFSRDFLQPWTSPARDLHGIGKYGEDAWRLFCCGDLGIRLSLICIFVLKICL